MNKAFKCALAVFLLAAFLSAVPAYASLPEPGVGAAYYVQDEANVLSSETEEQIINYNINLEMACDGAQLVVVTVNYLDEDADVAATRLMNDRGVGSADESNGMLLLLVAKEARGGVTAGDGIDEAFYDGFSERYYDDFWDDVDAGRFDDAVRELTGHIYDWYTDYYDVPEQSSAQYGDVYYEQPAQTSRSGLGSFVGVVFLFILVVLIIWVVGAASRFTRMRSWGYTGGFFPVFWFGGSRRYRDWYRRQPPPPPGGFGGGPAPGPRPPVYTSFNRSARPRSSGFGGVSRGGSTGRSGGGFRSGGSFRGGGFGGHSGGGFRGRR